MDRRDPGPRREMGAEIVLGVHPETEDAPVPVQRHLRRRPLVARVGVRRHPLAALGDPLDRPVEPPRGPEHERVLRKHPALHAETAADVARDHREAGFGDAEHALGEHLADPMGVLAAQMEPVAIVGRVVFPDRAARLHRHRGDPVVVEGNPGDAMRRREGGLHGLAVAHLDREAPVVRDLGPDRGRPDGPRGIDRRRELLVVDRHQLGRVERPVARLRDDESHRGPDMARGVEREGGGGCQPRGAGRDLVVYRHAGDRAETVRPVVLARQHGERPRRRARGGSVDPHDPRVGVWRPENDPMRHPRQREVVDIATPPGQEATVLAARNRLADAVLHALLPRFPAALPCWPVAGPRR